MLDGLEEAKIKEVDMEVAAGGWLELNRSDGDGYQELMDSEVFH